MPEIVLSSPARFQMRDMQASLPTALPISILVLVVSIPAALLTVLVMGCVYAFRFVAKIF